MDKRQEFFNYLGCSFDVNKAKTIAERLKDLPGDITPFRKMIFPKKQEGNRLTMGLIAINEDHAPNVNTATPIIVATLLIDGEESHVLIDGNHRVFKALYIEGKTELPTIVLSPEETLSIMSGPVAALQKKSIKRRLA